MVHLVVDVIVLVLVAVYMRLVLLMFSDLGLQFFGLPNFLETLVFLVAPTHWGVSKK